MAGGGVRVEGVEQLRALALSLREHGDRKELQKEFYSGINRSTKPLIKNVRSSALGRLPARGGLAKRVAASKITTSRRFSGASAGVRIVGKSGYDIRSINRGRVRHLVYGHRPWVNQSVRPNFWDDPLEAGAPEVRNQLMQVLDNIARKIAG